MQALELKLPPVLVTLLAAWAMWLSSPGVPSLTAPGARGKAAVGACLAASGIAFALAGVVEFRRSRTTVDPTRPASTSNLVASGVYRFSRNPMYVGMLLVLAGWAVFLWCLPALLWLPAFVLYMNRFQIVPEERVLSARFGSAYATYLRSVRRWL